MDEKDQPKKPRLALVALLVVASLAVLVAAVYAVGGIGFVTDLILGETDKPVADSTIPPKPSTDTTVAQQPAQDPASSTDDATDDDTDEATDSDDAGGTTDDDAGGTQPVTNPKPAASVDLGTERDWMYWEQVDSQESIGELVGGEWASFTITSVNKTATTASLDISGRYKDGSRLSGTMALTSKDGTWYFRSITADGNTSPGPSGRRGADTGVIATLVTEQGSSGNQAFLTGLLNGGYEKITVNSISKGSGTATIDLTLSGGSKGTAAARMVCISKQVSGRKYWFITKAEER